MSNRPVVCALVAAAVTGVLAPFAARALGLGPVDDAYISLRYAQNWASGQGLCFNSGERVEGYTNFLLVALEAGAVRLGLDPVHAMSFLGWASLASLASLVGWFARREMTASRDIGSVFAAVLVVTSPLLLCWAASGMETILFTTLLFAAMTAALNARTGGVARSAGFLLVLAGMSRPEGAVFLPVLAAAVWRGSRNVRVVLSATVVFVLGFGSYFTLRAMHFGYLFPNTFYTKLDYGNELILLRGARYLWDFALAVPHILLLAGVAAAFFRRSKGWVGVFVVVCLVQFAVVVYEGGDHFPMFRFLAPAWPFLAALAIHGCHELTALVRRHAPATRLATGLGLVAVLGSHLTVAGKARREEIVEQTHWARFRMECHFAEVWSYLGQWLGAHTPPDATISVAPIGGIGFFSGLRVIDPYGIVNPLIAHQRTTLGQGYPGHEKFDVDSVFAENPDYILLFAGLTTRPLEPHEQQNLLWSDADHRLHADPRLARNYRLESLATGEGYLNLYVRRDRATPK